MMTLTADTITDEQIRELQQRADKLPFTGPGTIAQLCRWALEKGHVQRYAARADLASILNARAHDQVFRSTQRTGQIVRLAADKPQFRIALVVADYEGKGDRVLVCKWLQNGRTWTQPRLEKRSALEAIDRDAIDGRLRRVVDSAIDSVRIAAGVVYYKGGSHKLGGIEVST